MNNNNSPKKNGFFHLPEIMRIYPDKPVPFRTQLAVMCTMLIISCLLFTVVFFQQKIVHGDSGAAVQISTADERSAAARSEENSTASVAPSEPSQKEKQESKKESKQERKQESKEEKVIETEASESAGELLGNMKTLDMDVAAIHAGELILVNKDYSCRYDGENVESMGNYKTDSYLVLDYDVALAPDVTKAFNNMMDDFESQFGENDVMVACGYRSYDMQVRLFKNEQDNSDEAEQWVAPPGYSEHQTGFVLDLDLNKLEKGSGIDFDGSGDYGWLNNNCQDYGFIVRYIAGKEDITGYNEEPWHFRYVGLPHSRFITEKGITLEEYIDMLHGFTADKPLVITDSDGSRYCIYYTAVNDWNTTEVEVPADRKYTISGDNYSGFIVTAKMDE